MAGAVAAASGQHDLKKEAKMNQSAAFVLLAVTVAAPACGADRQSLANWDPTGNDLVASCSATSEFESGSCIGFIQGVINGFNSGTTVQRGSGDEEHSILDLRFVVRRDWNFAEVKFGECDGQTGLSLRGKRRPCRS